MPAAVEREADLELRLHLTSVLQRCLHRCGTEECYAEILGGELVASPRPGGRHALAATRLAALLDGPFGRGTGGPGGWVILFEPELHLGRDVVVPDVAGWRRERMAEVPDVAFFTLAPDQVCEVLSAATQRHDRVRKLWIYARERVGHYWLVEPRERTLEVLRLDGEGYRIAATFEGVGEVRAEPFDAVSFDLAALWS